MDEWTRSQRRLTPSTSDDKLLWDLHASQLYLFWLAAADEFGLFSELDKAPATTEQLAGRLALGQEVMAPLLGALAALGFLAQYGGQFALTEVARSFLLPTSPYYRGPWLEVIRTRPPVTYASVREAMLRNQQLSVVAEGASYWGIRHSQDEAGAASTRATHTLTFAAAPSLAARGDFVSVDRLLDVGGGAGGMSIALALHYSTMHCTVIDRAVPCAIAANYIAEYGVQSQVDTVVADIFADPWPTGYDAVLLSHMLDSFDLAGCQRLLQKVSHLLPSGGRVFVYEEVVTDTHDGPLGPATLALKVHLDLGSQQFSVPDIRELLLARGFSDLIVTPTYGYYVLVSGTKP